MAVTRLGTAASTAATTLVHTVPAGTNRMLVACFSHEVDGQITITAVDYGGQAMVQAVQQDTPDTGFSHGCSIWYLLEAGIVAASTNVITPTYSSGPADEIIHAHAYVDVEQAGGATTNPATNSAETNGSTPNPLILDLIETDEGCVVAVVGAGNASSASWLAGMTEQTDQADASSYSSTADRLSTTGSNVDIEPTTASQNRASGCSATFAPAAIDITVTPSPVVVGIQIAVPVLSGLLSFTPSPVVISGQVVAPTVQIGVRTVTPSATIVVFQAVTPLLVAGVVTLAPTAVIMELVPVAPSVVIGIVTLTPAPVTTRFTVVAFTLVNVLTVAPSPLVVNLTLVASLVRGGGVSLTPSAVVATLTLAALTVVFGNIVTPSPMVATWQITVPIIINLRSSALLGRINISSALGGAMFLHDKAL